MAIIYSYPNGGSAIASDKLTISRSSLDAPIPNPTFTLTVAQIAAFVQNQLQSGTPNYIPVFNTTNTIIDSPMFLDNFAAPTLMTVGVATKIQGTLLVTEDATFNNKTEFYGRATFEEIASFQNSVFDETSTPGTAGQLLSSTGTAVRWVDPALSGAGIVGKIPLWVGNIQLGNSIMSELPLSIIEVAGDITVQGVEVNTTFKDGSGSTGNPGQVLSSTGTETAWVGGSTGTVNGTGTTNNLPLWSNGPNGDIGDSQLKQVGPNASGLYQLKLENADRFIINKPSSVTSGDPEYLIQQDGNYKVSMGWDDDGAGFGFLYNWAGDGWRFGSAGNNPELTIVTTSGSEGVDIANDLTMNGNAIVFGDLTLKNGLIDGDLTYGTAGQVLSTTGSGQKVKWVDTTTGAFKEVNEGNGLGIVKQSRNPNNYAPVGNEAFDASQSTSVSSTKGAEGDYAVALGLDVYARGDHSFAFGESSRSFNDYDIVLGHDSEAVGGNSVSIGWENKAQGAVSTAMGSFATASGDNSVAIGWRINATGSESNVFGKYNATTDQLFVVGNGNNATPSDLIVGKENGVILAPSLEINEILDPKCLVTLEYISAISSGIIGAGTIGNIPVWTTSTSLGDSIITQPSSSGIVITGDAKVINSTQLNGTLTVNGVSTFNADVTVDGKVGVNTTTPLANLDVKETTTDVAGQIIVGGLIDADDIAFGKLSFANTAAANSQPNKILASIEGRKNGSSNRGILTFGVADGSGSNWEKMRIDSYGNVGIGTSGSNPADKLHVQGTVRAVVPGSSGIAFNAINAFGVSSTLRFDNNHAALALKNNSNVVATKISSDGFSFFNGGGVGFGTTTPASPVEMVIPDTSSTTRGGLLLSEAGDSSTLDSVRVEYESRKDLSGNPGLIFTPRSQPSSGVWETFFRFKTNGGELVGNKANLTVDGKVGIGTTNDNFASRLTVAKGDIEVTEYEKGLILRSTNGTRYRLVVADDGTLTTTAV